MIQAAPHPQTTPGSKKPRVQHHSCKKCGEERKDSGKLWEQKNKTSLSFLFGKIKGPEQFRR